ncbi:AMP-binding enzyme family protein [Mycobacterium xenopi 3993]|nr:AMP-binding enzyme family protein [Mycobacterium xenopi 3993]
MPGNELGLRVEYDTDVFDADSIQTLIARLQRVLTAMTAEPTRRLSAVDLLDEPEHARLDGWGNRVVLTEASVTGESIPALFAAQVERSPDAVALTCDGRSMTYRELDEAANRLAHLLADRGAGPGQCVALLMERSAQAVIAILAVLKTGAAYLPIDPAHPRARTDFMLADAAPVAAITTAELADRFDGHGVVVVEADDPAIGAQPSTALPTPPPDEIAHIIYTSGTTGFLRGWRSPSAMSPSCSTRWRPVWSCGWAGVDAVSLLCVRFFGVGDLGCVAAWRAAGGGAGLGDALPGGLSRPAGG